MDLRLFLLQRLGALIVVIFGASILVFAVMHLLPGDPALALMGFEVSEEILEQTRRDLGLHRPVPVQYGIWLANAAQGDLGDSIMIRRPVTELLIERFPVTLVLGTAAILVALVIAVPAGVLAATYKGRATDHVFRIVALTGVSVPNFWFGLLAILVFAVELRWLPPGGYVAPSEGLVASLEHIILPAITLGTATAASISRMLRSSMLDVLSRDYILVAKSVGMSRRRIVWNDAFRNALIPTVTITGFAFGYLLAGTVLTEYIFNIPGIGRMLFEAILNRDYPVVQGVVIFSVTLFVVVNFIVDVLYTVLDPRIRY